MFPEKLCLKMWKIENGDFTNELQIIVDMNPSPMILFFFFFFSEVKERKVNQNAYFLAK